MTWRAQPANVKLEPTRGASRPRRVELKAPLSRTGRRTAAASTAQRLPLDRDCRVRMVSTTAPQQCLRLTLVCPWAGRPPDAFRLNAVRCKGCSPKHSTYSRRQSRNSLASLIIVLMHKLMQLHGS